MKTSQVIAIVWREIVRWIIAVRLAWWTVRVIHLNPRRRLWAFFGPMKSGKTKFSFLVYDVANFFRAKVILFKPEGDERNPRNRTTSHDGESREAVTFSSPGMIIEWAQLRSRYGWPVIFIIEELHLCDDDKGMIRAIDEILATHKNIFVVVSGLAQSWKRAHFPYVVPLVSRPFSKALFLSALCEECGAEAYYNAARDQLDGDRASDRADEESHYYTCCDSCWRAP